MSAIARQNAGPDRDSHSRRQSYYKVSEKERKPGKKRTKRIDRATQTGRPSSGKSAPTVLDKLILSVAEFFKAEADRIKVGTANKRKRRKRGQKNPKNRARCDESSSSASSHRPYWYQPRRTRSEQRAETRRKRGNVGPFSIFGKRTMRGDNGFACDHVERTRSRSSARRQIFQPVQKPCGQAIPGPERRAQRRRPR